MSRPPSHTDDQLLDAARDALIEDVGASLRAIAARVGLSHAALLKRFGSREQLVRAALGPRGRHPRDRFADGPGAGALVDQLVALCAVAESNLDRTLPNVLALQAAGHDAGAVYSIDGRPAPEVTHERVRRWLERAVARGRLAPCDLDGLSVALSGIVLARPLWRAAYGPLSPALDPDAYLRTAVLLLLDGLLLEEPDMSAPDRTTAADVATRIFDHLQACWNAHDGARYAEVFTEDADFVDIRGTYHEGRTAIAAGHAWIFDNLYRGSTSAFGLRSARPVGGTIVAQGVNTLAHPGGPFDGKSSFHTVVLVPDGGDWKIAAFHNTMVE